MTTIQIKVKVVQRTGLALLVSDGRTEAWVPWSEISDTVQEDGIFGREITAITIPEWLAVDKGLQRHQHDDNTLDLFGGGPL